MQPVPGHEKTKASRDTRSSGVYWLTSYVSPRQARLMNIPLALMDAIRRFAAGRGSPRVVEKRTYVFVLVPSDFRGNGHARKARIPQDLMGNGARADRTRADAPFSTLAALDRASFRITSGTDLSDDRELNHDLMWTWFLPNPLWPPNESKRSLANLFRFEQNGFNAKTRRKN